MIRWVAAVLVLAISAGAAAAAPSAPGDQRLFAVPFKGQSLGRADVVSFSSGLRRIPGEGLARLDGGRSGAFDPTSASDWPAVFSLNAGRLSLDLTPHAGLDASGGGPQSAEAGALLRLGARLQDRVLDAIGINGRQRSPWYLFAGASGRAVGLNLLRNQADGQAPLDGAGFVSETQAGVGFRKGMLHASVGYSHEKTTMRSLGEAPRQNDRIGLTLSLR